MILIRKIDDLVDVNEKELTIYREVLLDNILYQLSGKDRKKTENFCSEENKMKITREYFHVRLKRKEDKYLYSYYELTEKEKTRILNKEIKKIKNKINRR